MKALPLAALVAALAIIPAGAAGVAEPGAAARQNYVCAGVAGLASQLLEKSDPAGASRLAARAQLLAQSGVASEVGQKVAERDAVGAMVAFLEGRAAVYRANPAQAPADLAACRAQGMVPAGPGITAAQVAAAAGVAAPAPAAPAPRPAPPAAARAAAPARPAASPDAEFRRWLDGPWGRMKAGRFDTEMVTSTAFSRGGAQFTRPACPPGGLASVLDMLGHEMWFKVRPSGEFGITRAAGDPGKIRNSWITLTFKDQPAADTFRYEFFNQILRDTAVVTLKRLGADSLTYTVTVDPKWSLPATEVTYGRCRQP